MPTLIYNPGGPDEQVFVLGDAAVTIGRAEDQAICTPHRSLSRSQARIYSIRDHETEGATMPESAMVAQRQKLR
ncbi:hypothetical protein AB3662_04450 [Sorangium cellulosum]|uniref:hypothetical protein n=1 Tax=Sorangium cellulosum TaxID=56 RepID=UPI003D9A0B85